MMSFANSYDLIRSRYLEVALPEWSGYRENRFRLTKVNAYCGEVHIEESAQSCIMRSRVSFRRATLIAMTLIGVLALSAAYHSSW
jgi:hypothetical protein